MDLLTEVHAVEYMKDSMSGIMRVGLLSTFLVQEPLSRLGCLLQDLHICRPHDAGTMLQCSAPSRSNAGSDRADLQKYLGSGGRPSTSLEMQIKPPEAYGISKIPQPSSAAMLLQRDLRSDQSGGALSCDHVLCSWPMPVLPCQPHKRGLPVQP